jgi:DNA helicase-2/ATP-dependent DNA helicase PcrA
MLKLDELNPEQLEAVQNTDGPLLVLAGAGTGKTKVLTYRITNIVSSGLALPEEILAVTFTNKAAKEMLHRVNQILNMPSLTIGTFHAVSAKILRRNAELVGLTSYFSIIDYDDQVKLVKNILVEQNIDTAQYKPQGVLAVISKWKDLGIKHLEIRNEDLTSTILKIARNVYISYQQKLIESNLVDFGDLILYNTEIFLKHPNILSLYQEKYKYILIDEYQDTNYIQYLWAKLLSAKHNNICCVGDDDQSIYSWRGAEIENILRFERDFKNAKIIKLERNYRSTTPILHTASLLISKNHTRHNKKLWTDSSDGQKVKIVYCWNDIEEARFAAQEISLKSKIYDLNNIAILVRAGFQTRIFEEALISSALPYRIIGGLKFYERKEIRDILSYIRLTMNNNDNIALERIINVPKRSIGDVTLNSIKSYAHEKNISIYAAIEEMIARNVFKPKVQDALSIFINQTKTWKFLYKTTSTFNATKSIVEESGYSTMLKLDKSEESKNKLDNIHEMLRAIGEFEIIENFLEHASLVTDGDLGGDVEAGINLMTMHASKGLEFDLVFLPGWEEGVFPNAKTLSEEGSHGLEEERRLAYVGITRAKKELYISYADSRRIFNEYVKSDPSRFIFEIDSNAIERVNSNDNYNNHYKKFTPKESMINYNKIEKDPYSSGTQVKHVTFGNGIIIKSSDDNVQVAFSLHGIKTIKKNFIQLL